MVEIQITTDEFWCNKTVCLKTKRDAKFAIRDILQPTVAPNLPASHPACRHACCLVGCENQSELEAGLGIFRQIVCSLGSLSAILTTVLSSLRNLTLGGRKPSNVDVASTLTHSQIKKEREKRCALKQQWKQPTNCLMRVQQIRSKTYAFADSTCFHKVPAVYKCELALQRHPVYCNALFARAPKPTHTHTRSGRIWRGGDKTRRDACTDARTAFKLR